MAKKNMKKFREVVKALASVKKNRRKSSKYDQVMATKEVPGIMSPGTKGMGPAVRDREHRKAHDMKLDRDQASYQKEGKKKLAKLQSKIDKPATYMKGRVSAKQDRASLEGSELSEGSRIKTKSGTRKMTKSEGKEAFRADRAKYKTLDRDGTYRKRNKMRDRLKEISKERAEHKKRNGKK